MRQYKIGQTVFSNYFIGSMPMFTISEVKKRSSLPKPELEIDICITEDDLIRRAKEKREKIKDKKPNKKILRM